MICKTICSPANSAINQQGGIGIPNDSDEINSSESIIDTIKIAYHTDNSEIRNGLIEGLVNGMDNSSTFQGKEVLNKDIALAMLRLFEKDDLKYTSHQPLVKYMLKNQKLLSNILPNFIHENKNFANAIKHLTNHYDHASLVDNFEKEFFLQIVNESYKNKAWLSHVLENYSPTYDDNKRTLINGIIDRIHSEPDKVLSNKWLKELLGNSNAINSSQIRLYEKLTGKIKEFVNLPHTYSDDFLTCRGNIRFLYAESEFMRENITAEEMESFSKRTKYSH